MDEVQLCGAPTCTSVACTYIHDVSCTSGHQPLQNLSQPQRRIGRQFRRRRTHPPEIADRQPPQSWRHCRWKACATGSTPPDLLPAARCSKDARNSLLAATPPVTSSVATSCSRAASSVLLTRSFTTACWNDATRSSVCLVAGGEIILARRTRHLRQRLATPADLPRACHGSPRSAGPRS